MMQNYFASQSVPKLPELSNPASGADMLSGKQAIDQNGEVMTGSIETRTASDLSADGETVSVPAGYYASEASKSVATATQATPSITVSSAGLITASATQAAGYVAAGTKSATKQLTTQAAQTITPGTANKTIASGRYLTGTQTIKGDANLAAGNIKSGVSIFGVAGTLKTIDLSSGIKAFLVANGTSKTYTTANVYDIPSNAIIYFKNTGRLFSVEGIMDPNETSITLGHGDSYITCRRNGTIIGFSGRYDGSLITETYCKGTLYYYVL